MISEQTLAEDKISELTRFAESVYALLPEANLNHISAEVIDDVVYAWQQSGNMPIADVDSDELVYALGTLWGNAVIEKHKWHWATLTFHEFGDWEGRAAVAPDSALFILPYAHIHECLAGEDEVKISASLAVIGSNVIPEFPPSSFENVMHGIQRIIPRG